MANKRISELPVAVVLNATDKMVVVQGGVTKQVDRSIVAPFTEIPLSVANGGTGSIDPIGARAALGVGDLGTQSASSVAITGGSIETTDLFYPSIFNGTIVSLVAPLDISQGGTAASTASGARTNLGLGTLATQNASGVAITGGSITGITDLAVADGGTGASSAAGARTNLGVGSLGTQDSSSVTITGGSISGVGISLSNISANAGSALLPSISFTLDLDTGIYNSGANQIAFTTAGSQRWTLLANGSWAAAAGGGQLIPLGGSAIAPSLAFSGDTGTGVFQPSPGVVAISNSGIQGWAFESTGILSASTGTGQIVPSSGSAAAPSLAFTGDSDTGIYRPAANAVGISTGGALRTTVDSAGNIIIAGISAQVQGTAGTALLPAYTFAVDNTTGFFQPVLGQISVSNSGAQSWTFQANGDFAAAMATGQIIPAGGSAVAPALTFQADTDTGVYRVGANTLGISTGGSQRVSVDGSGNLIQAGSTAQMQATAGTALLPSHSFNSDTDTGIYSTGANQIGIATGGSLRITVDASGNLILSGVAAQMQATAGTALLPSHSFSGDTDTGFYSIGANQLGIATGGSLRASIDSSGNLILSGATAQIGATAGTALLPSISFASDPNTGIYNSAIDQISFTTGGSQRWSVLSTGSLSAAAGAPSFLSPDGTAAAPGVSFPADTDTGIYRVGANRLGLATAGNPRWEIDATGNIVPASSTLGIYLGGSAAANFLDRYEEGTFTPTVSFATPGTSSFVYTVQSGTYRRIGDFVHINIRLDFTPTVGTGSGQVFVNNLPFVAGAERQAITIGYYEGITGGFPGLATQVLARLVPSGTQIIMAYAGKAVTPSSVVAADLASGAAMSWLFSGGYYV